jgi:serralysin
MPSDGAPFSSRELKLAAALALILGACAGADESVAPATVVEVEEEESFNISWEEYLADAVVAGDGYFIAEWDLMFETEEELRAHYEREFGGDRSKLATFQRVSNGFEPTYVGYDALDITYCVSNTFANKSTVVADMAAGTRAWQNVMNVKFRYVSAQDASCNQNNANVDFAVMPTTVAGLWGCGSSKLMWGTLGCTVNGVSGVKGVLTLQYSLLGAEPFPGTSAVGLILHELGHVLGFRHEHPWAPGGCSETPTIPALDVTGRRLTEYDQVSVMHYPTATCNGLYGTDYVLSTFDGRGGRSVYGVPASWHVPRQTLVLN